jgi:hypothetical protein
MNAIRVVMIAAAFMALVAAYKDCAWKEKFGTVCSNALFENGPLTGLEASV